MSDTVNGPDLPPVAVIHATAVNYLLEGGEYEEAELLISAQLVTDLTYRDPDADLWIMQRTYYVTPTLIGPRVLYDRIEGEQDRTTFERFTAAFRAAIPRTWHVLPLQAQLEPLNIGEGWRAELLERARGLGIDNQGIPVDSEHLRTWNNLRFRSESEVKIAGALDEAGALYWPNCKSRLGKPTERRNLEADFLVCWRGKWGILEVDGEPFHPPERRTQEQERDRGFHLSGVKVVQHFDADRCYRHPRDVVRSFLMVLRDS